MLLKLLVGGCLMAVCVAIHVGGLTAALQWFRRDPIERPDAGKAGLGPGDRRDPDSFWGWTRLFTAIAGWSVLLHLVEICAWAVYYRLAGAIPDLTLAAYFSAVTYTTTGYGDVVLPEEWRLVGGIEALTGILMCGWSTGVSFAVLSRMLRQVGHDVS